MLKTYHIAPAKFLSAPVLAYELENEHVMQFINMQKLIKDCDMKDYDKNKESPYLKYWDVNSLYGWETLQKLPVNNFEWIEDTFQFNEDFIKSHDEESIEGFFLEVDIQYPEKLHELQNNSPFLPERMKIENVEKPVTNLHDKSEYVIHIKNIKQALNHELVLKKVHRVIKFNQKGWLKRFIDMNTKP